MPKAAGLWYQWHGPEDCAPLILSPGLGGSAQYWQPNLAAFAERRRVLLYDHRGTGRSDRELQDKLSVEDMARDLIGLIDALGIERADLVGHAAGGMIGLALALAAPERLGRLVVVNGWARLDPYTARCFDVRLALLRDSGPEAYLRAQPIFLYPPDWISAHSDRLDAEVAGHLADFPGREAVEARVAALRGFDIGADLGRIDTPALVLAAADDFLVPASAGRRLAEGLANGRWMLQSSGGHACNVVEPDLFHRNVLPWLAGETLIEE